MKRSFVFLFLFASAYFSCYSAENIVVKSAREEINKAMTSLKNQKQPPYFIGYEITDVFDLRLSSSFGRTEACDSNRMRLLDIDLRVGSHKLDNTHIIRGERVSFSSSQTSFPIPEEDNEAALKNAMWFSTDIVYKNACETYDKVLTNKQVKVAEEDTSADFSVETPTHYSDNPVNINIDYESWKAKLNEVTALFERDKKIYDGNAALSVKVWTKYTITSEGTEVVTSQPYIRIFIYGLTKAEDGMSLPLYNSYFAFSPDQLPTVDSLKKDTEKMIKLLGELREAPLFTGTYSGPAILSGGAAGVFFHEIFGHRVEGSRQKNPDDAQTFKNAVGTKVLSNIISVYCDPTLQTMRGNLLSGYYKYDDEGIKSQRVTVAENGIFRNFLMGRSPIEGFDHSNGHGRKEYGYSAVSRQSNLIVESSVTMSRDSLRKALIAEAKRQGLDFGLYFVEVEGGFTFTGRSIPNSFNVNPLLVYKIYTDGRPDEILRGVDLIGTPLTTFANITAAANDFETFNGICGAESGGVPVSASSPSLLVSKIEVQKKKKSQAKLPVLPAPEMKVIEINTKSN